MSADFDPVRAGVRELRAFTATETDGRATRARVLAAAGRRARLRLALPLVAAGLLLTASGGAAWSALSRLVARWHAPPAVSLAAPSSGSNSGTGFGRPVRTIPPVTPLEPDGVAAALEGGVAVLASGAGDEESRTYGRAHRLHFFGGAPARALAAWDDYLRRFPRGAFAPEARFNRALCLIRVGRLDEAAAALRSFDGSAPEGYRRDEARRLLDWIGSRGEP